MTTERVAVEVKVTGAEAGKRKIRGLREAIDYTKKSAKSLTATFFKMGKIIAAIAFGGFILAMRKATKATIAQENALKQLEARLKSTNNAVGLSSKEIRDYAAELQKATTFGDEEIIGMQNILLTFTGIVGETFKAATETILDMSTVLNQDLKSSAVQLGKALNDPIKGVSALSRVGVSFTDVQKDMIKGFVETGDKAAAQNVILKEMSVEFGNAAREARKTFGGALKALGNAFSDLWEGEGSPVKGATSSINDLTDLLASPATKSAFAVLVGLIFSVVNALVQATSAMVMFSLEFRRGLNVNSISVAADTLEKKLNPALESAREETAQLQNQLTLPIGSREGGRANEDITSRLTELAQQRVDMQESVNALRNAASEAGQAPIIEPEAIKPVTDLKIAFDGLGGSIAGATNAAKAGAAARKKAIPKIKEEKEEISDLNKALASQADSLAQGFGDTLVSGILEGKLALEDFFKTAIAGFAKMLLYQTIMKPLLGGFSFGAKGLAYDSSGILPMAQGGVIANRKPQLLSRGAVIDQPTLLAGGAAIGGEAGPEGVLPLKRTKSGDLGVQMSGGGGTTVNVYNNNGSEVTVEEKSDGNGGVNIQVMVENAMREGFSSGRMDGSMRQFGASRVAM